MSIIECDYIREIIMSEKLPVGIQYRRVITEAVREPPHLKTS